MAVGEARQRLQAQHPPRVYGGSRPSVCLRQLVLSFNLFWMFGWVGKVVDDSSVRCILAWWWAPVPSPHIPPRLLLAAASNHA